MGLMKEYREFKAKKKAEKMLSLVLESEPYKELLAKIALLEQEVALLKKKNNSTKLPNGITEKDIKKLEAMTDGRTTPEDFVKLFADEREEFYPNGRPN